MAHDAAQMAHDRAEFAKNESETSRADLEALIKRITVFLSNGGATPQEVRDVGVVLPSSFVLLQTSGSQCV